MPMMRELRITWIKDRVRAAGRLVLSAHNEMIDAPPQAFLDLVNLELVTIATSAVLREFIRELVARRIRIGPMDCPHCGHPRFYDHVDRCPRCSTTRGVSRESAAVDPVRLHRRLHKPEG